MRRSPRSEGTKLTRLVVGLFLGAHILFAFGCISEPPPLLPRVGRSVGAGPPGLPASGDHLVRSPNDSPKTPAESSTNTQSQKPDKIDRTRYEVIGTPIDDLQKVPSNSSAPGVLVSDDDEEMSSPGGSPGAPAPRDGGAGRRRSRGSASKADSLRSRPRAEREGEGGGPSRSEERLDLGADTENPGPDLLNQALELTDSRLSIFGWAQVNFTGAPRLRSGANLFGVNPNNLANAASLQQFYLVAERKLDPEAEGLDFGFRLDSLFGNDWQNFHDVGLFNNAFLPNHPGYDFVQMYGEVHLPIPDQLGLDVKVGRFYSLVGFEEGMAPLRPLLSTGYMFSYGHPFTHLGVMTVWKVRDRLTVYNGVVNGWDRWFNQSDRWGYAGAIAFDSHDDRSHLSLTLNTGPNQFHRFLAPNLNDPPNGVTRPPGLGGQINPFYSMNNATLITLTGSHAWTDRLSTILEADYAFESAVPFLTGQQVRNASWGGMSGWMLYNFRENLIGVARAEFFNDPSGLRTNLSNIYSEETLGLIYKPKDWLWLRPEIRFDQSSKNPAFNDNRSFHQFTLGFDMTILF